MLEERSSFHGFLINDSFAMFSGGHDSPSGPLVYWVSVREPSLTPPSSRPRVVRSLAISHSLEVAVILTDLRWITAKALRKFDYGVG